jgi:ribosomal protein L5
MTSPYYCIDQQVIHWHYRTVCRYQLAVKPGGVPGFTANLFKNITNGVTFDKFLKSQKVEKYTLPWQVSISKALRNGQELSSEEKGFIEKVIEFLPTVSTTVSPTFSQRTQYYANHIKFWRHINNITLHITSGKLLSNIELYPSFYIAFCCFGNQAPLIIRSKRAVAEFSVIRGAIIGARSHLKNQNRLYFLYKWAFIAAGLDLIGIEHSSKRFVQCLGIHNIFIFPELDKYDYYLFQPIGGFDLTFNNRSKIK